jgi:hypothetical protein
MAIKFPLANGNWSNAANWNDGTLPDVGDDVHADGKTVTIDQDVTVLTLRTDQRSGGTNGGLYNLSNILTTYNLVANEFVVGNAQSLLTTNFDNKTINIIGTFVQVGTINFVALNFQGSNCVINVTGSFESNKSSGLGFFRFDAGSSSSFNLVGNFIGVTGYTGSGIFLTIVPMNVISVTGNLQTNTTSRIMQIGNVLISQGIQIYGTLTGGIYSTEALNGVALNNDLGSNVIYADKCVGGVSRLSSGVKSAGFVVVKEIVNTFEGAAGVLGPVKWANDSIKITGYREDGTQFILSDGVGDANFIPNPANVRSGITYNLDQNTGTLVLPTEDNVRKGVVYDNFDKTGTADLTADDFNQVLDDNIQNLAEGILQAIQDSTTPLAERLRNVSTVQTTGDQISTI